MYYKINVADKAGHYFCTGDTLLNIHDARTVYEDLCKKFPKYKVDLIQVMQSSTLIDSNKAPKLQG
jgi:hypothetical protein